MTFNKLSFLGIAKLQENFLAWATGNDHAGYEEAPKELLRDGKEESLGHFGAYAPCADNYILRPQLDKESYAVADAYGE